MCKTQYVVYFLIYVLSDIQVGSVFANTLISDNYTENKRLNIFDIKSELEFYNSEKLGKNLMMLNGSITQDCFGDLKVYVESLKIGETWALKMDDSSGRYSSGWFWGNQHWIGSRHECLNIIPKQPKYNERFGNSPIKLNYYNIQNISIASSSPYGVTYFTLTTKIKTNFSSNEEREIKLGLCLPLSCRNEDVVKIVKLTASQLKRIELKIIGIKSEHTYFDVFQDTTFWLLCGVTAVVVLLLIGGTIFDYYLENYSKNAEKHNGQSRGMLANNKFVPKFDDKEKKINIYIIDAEDNNCLNLDINIDKDMSKKSTNTNLIYVVVKDSLLSFSLRRNIKIICEKTVGDDTISIIHGLKAISMLWVILGHTCQIAFIYSDNMEYRKVAQKQIVFQAITAGVFSVDSFFFTSGLLVSFLYFRVNKNGKLDAFGHKGFLSGCLHFLGLIGYRFARLTPPYAFVLCVLNVSMKWFHSNAIFNVPTLDHENCSKYWWRNILYINTLFPVDEMCMLWSWYLSDDTQFYIVGAILLILATRYFKIAASALLIFIISSWLTTGYISIANNYTPSTNDPLALFDMIYDKPWTRLGPYLIGMAVGWILYKTNCRIKMTLLMQVTGWIAWAICFFALIFGLYGVNLPIIAGGIYNSLSHSFWAISLGWIAIVCVTGNGGIVNTILSATILYPISRLSYCAYLLQPLIMRIMIMNMEYPIHLGTPLMAIIFMAQIAITYAFAFVVSLTFEAPVVSLLKILTKLPVARCKNKC